MSDDFAGELVGRAAETRARARDLVRGARRVRTRSGFARHRAEEIARDIADHRAIQDLLSSRRHEPLDLSAEVEAILHRTLTHTSSDAGADPGSPPLRPSPSEPEAPLAALVGATPRRSGPAPDDG